MRKKSKSDIAFLKNIKDTIKHYGMIEKGDKVLVAIEEAGRHFGHKIDETITEK